MLSLMDSGAVPNVANHKKHFPGAVLRESPGQKSGMKYVVASGGEISNDGEFDVLYKNVDMTGSKTVFQNAAVGIPIFSISQNTEDDCEVTFRTNGGTVLHPSTGRSSMSSRLRVSILSKCGCPELW